MTTEATGGPGLMDRLAEGAVICAEGYVFELERRGYLQAGGYVPEVLLEEPEAVSALHRDFLRAGSDVIEAMTYYAHREKLRIIGKEGALEEVNRIALRLAKEVASEGDALVAGNTCNTNVYESGNAASAKEARTMFEEQVGWAIEAGVDFIVAETFSYAEEAEIALDVIKDSGAPSVITLAMHKNGFTREGLSSADACKRLEDRGADVVGLNCARGPATMLPLLKEIRNSVSGHVAALPVPYRTTADEPTFQSLTDPGCDCVPDNRSFPTALDPFTCTRYEIAEFTKEAYASGIRYLGVCCGAGPHHVRAMAEALGRQPTASKYSPDMSKHAFFGSDPELKDHNVGFTSDL